MLRAAALALLIPATGCLPHRVAVYHPRPHVVVHPAPPRVIVVPPRPHVVVRPWR